MKQKLTWEGHYSDIYNLISSKLGFHVNKKEVCCQSSKDILREAPKGPTARSFDRMFSDVGVKQEQVVLLDERLDQLIDKLGLSQRVGEQLISGAEFKSIVAVEKGLTN
ncbi:MAG: hypothetical protein COA79_15915 [Planctomycetota bacterium]|nr:MAG: hypothetical protein COA79_15915 [Planctomycetota bacterium]